MADTKIALMAHLMRRAGFGAPYAEVEARAAKGYEATVEELLHPDTQPAMDADVMMRYKTEWVSKNGLEGQQEEWTYRMINTRRPLEEKMALFWHGLFCTGHAKCENPRQQVFEIDMFRRQSDKRLLKRCGNGKGYLNEAPAFRSDLRVCASSEPKSGLKDPASRMFRKSTKTGNVLSAIESQGFRIRRASAPGSLKLMPPPPGVAQQSLKDTSSRKSALKRNERTAGRFCCNRHYPKAMGCRRGSRIR
jgi:hypothetical protein